MKREIADARPPRWTWILPTAAALFAAAMSVPLLTFASSSIGASPSLHGAGLVATAAALALLLWRVVLVARYRCTPCVADSELPRITVIVPAYNEGEQVYKSIASLMRSNYPLERLSVVAVDDGSTDDTWRFIEAAARRYGRHVVAIRCERNRGKRFALYEGFERSTGQVIVTVDSDSEVLPDTLRNLVSPLVTDAKVGAVAGNVRVLNDGHFLAKMLDTAFTYAFDFIRASESEVDAVQCCPGALSAYRKSFIDTVKARWLAQTFWGSPANIGEDRALTNLALQRGWRVKLQSNAIVLTEVPTQLPQLCRMLLRWARSNVRETLVLSKFVFSRFRQGRKAGARVNFVASVFRILGGALGMVTLIGIAMAHPALLGAVLLAAVLSAFIPATVYASTRQTHRAWWAIPYAVLSATALVWIGPYGLLTVHRSGWLTRQCPASPSLRADGGLRRPPRVAVADRTQAPPIAVPR